MSTRHLKVGSTDFILRKMGSDYVIEVAASKAHPGKPGSKRTFIKTPGPYVVEKRRGRYYVTEVTGEPGGRRTVFVAPGKKVSTSSGDRFEEKLTKAFASAVKSAT